MSACLSSPHTNRMNSRSLLCPSILILVFTANLSTAQEWPRFRGPNGSGIGEISSLPADFTKADYDWAVKLEGTGHSSPVLWGDRLFLTITGKDGEQRRVECYDGVTGGRQWAWSAPVREHPMHKYNNFASSTPVATADGLYLAWASGERTEAIGLDHRGNLRWRREWPNFSSDHGFGASPIVVDGVLVLHTDAADQRKSYVLGLDPASGETLWRLERITPETDEKHLTAYNTPAAVEMNGEPTVAVLQTNDGWKGVAPKTGEVVWAFPGDYRQRSVGSIAAADGLVFATLGSGGGGKQATALRPTLGGKPEVLYELGIRDGLSYVPTPLLYEGRLYLWGDGGVLTCRDAKSGELVYQKRVGGNFFSSPIVADDKIWCGSRDGELVSVAPGDEFRVLGRTRLSSGMNATPAVANNRLFLRTDTHLICIEGR